MKTSNFWAGITLLFFLCACKSSSKLFSAGSAPAEKYMATVAMEDKSNLQILPVKINGKTYRFLFDTGAPMVISKELQEELKCKVVAKKKVTDSQGETNIQNFVRLSNIELGGQTFTNLTAIVIDLKATPVISCFKMDGIIGANLMQHAIWQMDYKNGMLTFTNDTSKLKAPESALELPFEIKATSTPVVSLTIDSTTLKNITFDTGSGSGLSITAKSIPEIDSTHAPIRTSYGYHSYGVFGTSADSMIYTNKAITVGRKTVENVLFKLSKTSDKGLLGSEFLRNFVVTMDWKKRMIYLDSNDSPIPTKSVGFAPFYNENKLYVGSVIQHSKADKAGVRFKDQIIRFNGRDCSQLSLEDFCEIMEVWEQKTQTVEIEIAEKGALTFDWEPLFAP